MMKVNRTTFAAIFGFAVVTQFANAGTVAWYRFDEKTPGSTIGTSETLSILDAADNCAPGTAYAYTNTAAVTDGTLDAYKPTYAAMPVTAGSRAGIVLWDPVAAVAYTNRAALAFTCAAEDSTRNYYGGSVKIDRNSTDARSRWACASMTVEAFVKAPTEWANYTGSGFIFESTTSGSAQKNINLSLTISNAGILGVDFKTVNTPSDDECFMGHESFSYGDSGFFNDNKWHHVAVTYDATSGTATLYVDYVAKANMTSAYGAGNLAASNGQPFYIGGPENALRRFKGWIDEVRVSDTALTPDAFLRMKCAEPTLAAFAAAEGTVGNAIADQTDIADSAFSTTLATVVGASSNVTMTLCKGGDSTTVRYCADVPGAQVRNGFRSPDQTANASALEFRRTSATSGASVRLTPMTDLYANSFTAELFYKLPTTTPSDWAGATLFGQSRTGGSRMMYSVYIDSRNYLSYTTYDDSTNLWSSYGHELTDGKWHHAALVYDKDAKTVKVYGDYQLKIWVTDITLHKSPQDKDPYFGSIDGTQNFFNGQLDEMRIVKKALSPVQFLTVSAEAGASYAKTRAFWDFEGTKAAEPYAELVGDADFGANGTANPKYATKVPVPTYAYDGTTGQDVRTNTMSIKLNGGFIGFATSSVVEDGSFTAEYFADFTSATSLGASIFRIIPNATSAASYRSAEPIVDVTLKSRDVLNVVARMKQGETTVVLTQDVTLPKRIVGQPGWQHLAFTCQQSATEWKLTVYVDHERAETVTFSGSLEMPIKSSMAIGASQDASKALYGYIDLFRVSDPITDTNEFIGPLCTPPGCVLIYR